MKVGGDVKKLVYTQPLDMGNDLKLDMVNEYINSSCMGGGRYPNRDGGLAKGAVLFHVAALVINLL